MPVASCVATGTALRAAIRSLLAREGFPPQAPPFPARFMKRPVPPAFAGGTGRFTWNRKICTGKEWEMEGEDTLPLDEAHLEEGCERVERDGRRPAGPLRASAARIKEATPPQRLPLENKRPLARKRARGLGIKNERTAYRLAAYQSPARRRPVRTSNWGS